MVESPFGTLIPNSLVPELGLIISTSFKYCVAVVVLLVAFNVALPNCMLAGA